MNRRLAALAWIYVAFGCLGFVASPILGEDLRSYIVIFAIVALLPAAWTAWKVHGFPRSLIAVVATVGLLYVASAIVEQAVGVGPSTILTSGIDLVANALIIGAFAYVLSRRRGRFTTGDVLDGVLIGLGSWLAAWITLVLPFVDESEHTAAGLVLDAMYLPMATPVFALAAAVVFSGLARRPATWLVVVAMIANVVGDALWGVTDVEYLGEWGYGFATSFYIIAYTFCAAAFIHPTAPELIGRTEHHRRLDLPGRLLLTAIALVIPILLVALVPATSTPDRLVRAVSSLAILGLASWRLYDATRAHLRAQERLVEAARTDRLTGLPNRAALQDATAEQLETVWRHGVPPAVFLFDLDRFKNINDSLGHRVGDQVLQIIGERLRVAAEAIGVVIGRASADEFVALDTASTTPGKAIARAEVLHEVFRQPLSLDEGVVFVTASVGVATSPVHIPAKADDLFRWADIAMYRAKDAGRNCLAVYDESMQERLSQRMATETALHGALDRRELRLFHQPIVDIESGRVAGFEALIRWQRDDGSMMSPAEFVPIAEETGIITSIGSWALLEAMTQLRQWIDDGVVADTTTVSVNVSPRQLSDPHFTDTVDEALRRSGLPPHLLWLEVTESIMITEPDLARATLQRIRASGVRIALDDFGTGYSSLSLLQQFPLQRIKIDRAFINGIAESNNDRSLVRTILAMGSSLGLDIVAEGVESVQQLKLLQELDCPKAQGFLISHPVPAEAMRSTIAALESLAQWPEFRSGARKDEPRVRRSPIAGT